MTLNNLDLKIENQVAVVTLNRPKSLNALNIEVITELETAFKSLIENPEVRSILLTGAGDKAFVAGADIKEMENYGPEQALKMSQRGQQVFSLIEACPKPVIAVVNGFALGGGFELALSCDFIMAAETAKFGLPEVGLGLIPGYGGTQRLARNVGPQKAKRLFLTGEMLSAQVAYEWGVVTSLHPLAELHQAALKLAGKISTKAPRALALAKKSSQQGFDQTLQEGLSMEAQFFSEAFSTEDKSEGIAAFIAKRKPVFTGK